MCGCGSVDDSNIRAFVTRMDVQDAVAEVQDAVAESAGSSTLCKIITWGIAFFSLALAATIGALIATGVMAATGGSAVIAFSFFVFILAAIAIYVDCRAERRATAELNEFLGQNPGYKGNNSLGHKYNVRFEKGVYYFSKKENDQSVKVNQLNRMASTLGAEFSPDRILYVNKIPLLVDTSSGIVTTKARSSTQRFGRTVTGPDDIYILQTRVRFSEGLEDPTPLPFAGSSIDFVKVSEEGLGVYQFYGYDITGHIAQSWTVNTHKQFRLLTLDPTSKGCEEFIPTGKEILQTEKVYIPNELLQPMDNPSETYVLAGSQKHVLIKLPGQA